MGLKNSIKTNDNLYKKWKKSFSKKLPKGDDVLHEKYSLYRKNLRNLIRIAKSKFYCKKITDHSGENKTKIFENKTKLALHLYNIIIFINIKQI